MATEPLVIEKDHVLLGDDGDSLSPLAENYVRAWTIEIRGTVKTAGQYVNLVANRIIFSNGTIDTTGNDGHSFASGDKPNTPPTPAAGSSGAKGTKGDDGGKGANGGDVDISARQIDGVVRIIARGGAGGRGQDGGSGSPGGPYSGQAPPMIHAPYGILNKGYRGTTGGQGGLAGAPGSAGDGGNVRISLLGTSDAVPKLTCKVDLAGGAAPPEASPGPPGGGGPGGPDGVNGGPKLGGLFQVPNPGQHGPNGPDGPDAPPQISKPTPGAPGKVNDVPAEDFVTQYVKTEESDFATDCSPVQMWAILQQGETEYMNGNYSEAADRLQFVASLSHYLSNK